MYQVKYQINNTEGKDPLIDYPWRSQLDRMLAWLADKDASVQAFCFDLVMSAAYIDATSGMERSIEQCDGISEEYNAHMGFINLCSPCFTNMQKWSYQKAVKPESGSLGKLSSEVILRFIEKLHSQISKVKVIGGTETADAILEHKNGTVIFAEVKSAPLMTYPFIFQVSESCLKGNHEKIVITSSQLRACNSAIYLHGIGSINLGKVGDDLWPFKALVEFIVAKENTSLVNRCANDWAEARDAYSNRDRQSKMYYLTNSCGRPPKIAKDRDGWPKKESISDGKTSAGMDRTDDIKKGIYQTLKIGTSIKSESNFKTAIISNLPAYRHKEDYVDPFIDMLWGLDEDVHELNGQKVILMGDLRRVFDYIITLEEPILRDIKL
jgi:hypothetical protein